VLAKRPDAFNSTVQGKLEAALTILKVRYHRNFPQFIKAVSEYQERLAGLSGAGMKLAAELSKLGSLYKNPYGDSLARLGQQMTEVESLRNGLAGNITQRFVDPMTKSLADEKNKFLNNEKKVTKTIQGYESSLQAMIHNLSKEQPAGTSRILENIAAITKKVQEFEAVNVEMLRDLQQSQQKQFIEWSEKWHLAVSAQLDYHVAMEKKLDKLKSLWQLDSATSTGGGNDTSNSTNASAAPADEAPAAPAPSKPSASAPAPKPKAAKGDKADKADKVDKAEKAEKADKPEKSDKAAPAAPADAPKKKKSTTADKCHTQTHTNTHKHTQTHTHTHTHTHKHTPL
jgi:hypothetical protein